MFDGSQISDHPSCSAITLDHLQILSFSPHCDEKDDHKVPGDAMAHPMLTL
jgi:hypothetical protein